MCSGAGLMAALRVQHPAATLLKEAVHGQQEDTGTGSTLLLSAVGPLLDCAMRLLRDGCALPTIMGALRRMQEAGRVLFAAAAVDLHQLSGAAEDDKAAWLRSRLAGFEGLANEPAGRGVLPGGSDSSRHPLNWQERLGMGLAHGAEQAMQLAMAAVALLEDRRACLRAASLSRSQRARARQGHRRVTAPINVLLAPGLGQEASVVAAGVVGGVAGGALQLRRKLRAARAWHPCIDPLAPTRPCGGGSSSDCGGDDGSGGGVVAWESGIHGVRVVVAAAGALDRSLRASAAAWGGGGREAGVVVMESAADLEQFEEVAAEGWRCHGIVDVLVEAGCQVLILSGGQDPPALLCDLLEARGVVVLWGLSTREEARVLLELSTVPAPDLCKGFEPRLHVSHAPASLVPLAAQVLPLGCRYSQGVGVAASAGGVREEGLMSDHGGAVACLLITSDSRHRVGGLHRPVSSEVGKSCVCLKRVRSHTNTHTHTHTRASVLGNGCRVAAWNWFLA